MPFELDPVQRAVAAFDGEADVIVLGAPGTGKTTTAIELVARRLAHPEVDPGSVLVVAPSRRVASRLREVLASRVGRATPGPLARTIASIAHGVLMRAAADGTRLPPVYVSGAEQDRIIAELIEREIADRADGRWPTTLGPSARLLPAFRGEIRELAARAAERGLDAEGISRVGAASGRQDWVVAGQLLQDVDRELARLHPGADPIDSVVAVRRAGQLVREDPRLVGELRLLVIDDAQELGRSGLDFVHAIASAGVRIVALGDPDVATGGFRGADPGGFVRGFGRPVEQLVLPTVHRHGTEIRQAITRATSAIGTAGAGTQRAATPADGIAPGLAEAVALPERGDVLAFVARGLRERAVSGTPWHELAVVVRSSASVPRIARELRALEVPALAFGTRVDDDGWATESLVALVATAIDLAHDPDQPIDPETAELILTGSYGRIDAIGLRRLRTALRRIALSADPDDPRRGRQLVAEALATPGGFAMLESPEGRAAHRVALGLHRTVEAVRAGGTIEDVLWAAWSSSGLGWRDHDGRLRGVWGETALGAGRAADEANRHLDAVMVLFDAAKRHAEREPHAPPRAFIDAWLGARVGADSIAPTAERDRVAVGTPASLLGVEFDTVYVLDLQDGIWPNPRVRGSLLGVGEFTALLDGEDLSLIDRRREVVMDELRLLTSAMGRARRAVIAVAVDGEEELPSTFMRIPPRRRGPEDVTEEAKIPLTMRGMTARLRRELTRTGDPTAAAALAVLAEAEQPGAHPDEWYGIPEPSTTARLVDEDEQITVHPSELSTYLECPLHWALRRLGADTAQTAASIGTIVHDAAHALAETEVDASAEAILEYIRGRWAELEFESEWIEERELARAGQIAELLAEYQRDLVAAGGRTLASETRLDLEIGRTRLRGRIDRVDIVNGPDGEVAIVVDFKTGQETKYQGAKVQEHPQLAAYQLALEAGAIEGAEAVAVDADPTRRIPSGGAKLVILAPKATGKRERAQTPLDAEQIDRWRATIQETGEGMAQPVFTAYLESHCESRDSGGLCPVHIIPAVSA